MFLINPPKSRTTLYTNIVIWTLQPSSERRIANRIILLEILQAMCVRHRRAYALWEPPGAYGLFHQRLDFLSIDGRRNFFDGKNKSGHMSSTQPAANSIPQLATQQRVEIMSISHNDKEKHRLIVVDALPGPSDTKTCFNHVAERPCLCD